MPAPASEDDLKRRARRRLIGAVALTLIAVIVLPLMLEDEPPPTAQLEVHMPAVTGGAKPDFIPITPARVAPIVPAPEQVIASKPIDPEPRVVEPVPEPRVVEPAIEKPKPVLPPVKKPTPPKPAVDPELKTAPEKSSAFVVQLGAFSDAAKTAGLKRQVDDLGMSSYTDKTGALTRLRVGPFPSRQAAVDAAARLADAGVDGQVMPK